MRPLIFALIALFALPVMAQTAPSMYSLSQNPDGSWTSEYTIWNGTQYVIQEFDVSAAQAPDENTATSVSFEMALAQSH